VSLEAERGELMELVARGYYPGRSGQILFVPEPEDFFLRQPMGFYRFMHGSPWEYDRHIPLLFYGPGLVSPGNHTETAHQQDIAATLLSRVGIIPAATMSGRALDSIFRDVETLPRVAAVLVLDGMRADYFERYADVMPTLTRMRREGANFENAWMNYVPTVTSAGHTTIGTGADPRVHGIAGNGYYDRARGREATLFEGLSPQNVMVLGIADLWNLHFDGDAVIIAQGTTPRATVSLAGHGACTPNGRAPIMAMFDYRDEGWVTNPDCFVLPEYLESASARTVWEAAGGRWRDFDIDNGRVFVMTPLFPEFQADALVSMIERENVGGDEITDLVMASFKSPDYVGHNFGPDSEEMREALQALDVAIARALAALDAAAGSEGYVVAVTADHGMPSEPDGTGHERRFIGEVLASLHDELDPEQARLFFEFLDTANNQLFVDGKRMRQLGLELSDIATVVENLPFVRAAFTEDEIGSLHLSSN
jgi:hypothetical protein